MERFYSTADRFLPSCGSSPFSPVAIPLQQDLKTKRNKFERLCMSLLSEFYWDINFIFNTLVSGPQERQKTPNRGGLIAGIVIALGVLFAVLLIAVMYYQWRRGIKQFAAQRFENVEYESKAWTQVWLKGRYLTSVLKYFSSPIDHFIVVCLVTLPMNASVAGGDLALIQTSLLFALNLVSIKTTWFTLQKQWGVYQNKVTCSLAAIQRPGH